MTMLTKSSFRISLLKRTFSCVVYATSNTHHNTSMESNRTEIRWRTGSREACPPPKPSAPCSTSNINVHHDRLFATPEYISRRRILSTYHVACHPCWHRFHIQDIHGIRGRWTAAHLASTHSLVMVLIAHYQGANQFHCHRIRIGRLFHSLDYTSAVSRTLDLRLVQSIQPIPRRPSALCQHSPLPPLRIPTPFVRILQSGPSVATDNLFVDATHLLLRPRKLQFPLLNWSLKCLQRDIILLDPARGITYFHLQLVGTDILDTLLVASLATQRVCTVDELVCLVSWCRNEFFGGCLYSIENAFVYLDGFLAKIFVPGCVDGVGAGGSAWNCWRDYCADWID